MPGQNHDPSLHNQIAQIWAELRRLRLTAGHSGFDPNEDPVIIGSGATAGTGTPSSPGGGTAHATVVGPGAHAAHVRSTALGYQASTTAVDQVMVGTTTDVVVHPGLIAWQARAWSQATVAVNYTLPSGTSALVHWVIIQASISLTLPTATAGAELIVLVSQDATGGWSVTWPGTVHWPSGTTPTLTATANKGDLFKFLCIDGLHWHGITLGQNYS